MRSELHCDLLRRTCVYYKDERKLKCGACAGYSSTQSAIKHKLQDAIRANGVDVSKDDTSILSTRESDDDKAVVYYRGKYEGVGYKFTYTLYKGKEELKFIYLLGS